MEQSDSNLSSILAVISGSVVVFLLLLAMLPGLLLVTLFGGGGAADGGDGYGDGYGVGNEGLSVYESFTAREGGLSWPLANYGPESITSRFGRRSSPGGIGSTYHQGIDIGAPSGTLIHAAASGTVTISARHSVMGNYVEVDHGDGVMTRYEHMSKRLCKVGDTVAAGDVIGRVGSTGNSTGPHLHFEVWINGNRVDPMSVF